MKKKYIEPQMEVIEISATLLISGSMGGSATEPAHSREDDWDE